MNARQLHEAGGQRTFVLVFTSGDEEVVGALQRFAREQQLSAAAFTAIGAFESSVLGYFDLDARDYHRIPVDEQVEVLALTGNVTSGDEGPVIHAHVVIGKRDGSAHGGHLLEARARPTLEITLVESPAHLRRRNDPVTGLALITPRASS